MHGPHELRFARLPSACAAQWAARRAPPARCRATGRSCVRPIRCRERPATRPSGVSSVSSAATSTPQPRANALAACVGVPLRVERRLDRRAATFQRPVGLLLDSRRTRTARRRGVANRSTAPCCRPASARPLHDAVCKSSADSVEQRLRRQFLGADLDQEIPEGTHARSPVVKAMVPGNGGSRCRVTRGRPCAASETQCFATRVVRLGDAAREGAHAQDVALAFGDRDGLARVEQVERVRGLQHPLVGGQGSLASSSRRHSASNASNCLNSSSTFACSKLNLDCSTSFWWYTSP